MAYINGREIIDFVRFGFGTYALNGSWTFKDIISLPDTEIEQPLNYTLKGQPNMYSSMIISADKVKYKQDSFTFFVYIANSGWDRSFKSITIQGAQEVSKEFYEWFTANAVKITEA